MGAGATCLANRLSKGSLGLAGVLAANRTYGNGLAMHLVAGARELLFEYAAGAATEGEMPATERPTNGYWRLSASPTALPQFVAP